ncbi:MAG: M20/M25/M40 family metallo-hydrolase [Acidobacteria bacterium]|nr:M20/M25/M40 family metallo-hydrolase [Acidobacteriota bacterium]
MNDDVEAAVQARLDTCLSALAGDLRGRLARTIADLVRIPSENTPPTGAELEGQIYVQKRLEELGLKTEIYSLDEVIGLDRHPVFRSGRNYANRPNLAAVWPGKGGGRSLLLSGHIDTVPRGSEAWERDPFSAVLEGNRIYGLGSNDMKGGIAAMIIAVEMLQRAGVRLLGDLLLETIVDEEFGGVNGTLAARLRGHNADAAILCEPSQTMICPAQMGGRTAHMTLRCPSRGILSDGTPAARATDQLRHMLGKIEDFARQRRKRAPVHPLYAASRDPVPVWVTKIACGGWGPGEPIAVPSSCRIEIYWQCMPGEEMNQIDGEFFDWLEGLCAEHPELFPERPEVCFPIDWLPGSAIDERHELVEGLAESFAHFTGSRPRIQGIGGPCDMFVFHKHFDTPAVLFGPKGGNTHAPDEWVDLDSAFLTAKTLAGFICRWCKVAP